MMDPGKSGAGLSILIAWPPGPGRALAQRLRQISDDFDVTAIKAEELDGYLSMPDAYEILCVAPETWQALSPRCREITGQQVSVVVAGPDHTGRELLPEAKTLVTFTAEGSSDVSVTSLAHLMDLLQQGTLLSEALVRVGGTLEMKGQDYHWQRPRPPTRAGPRSGAGADASEATMLSGQPASPSLATFGTVNVGGDVVESKVVHHAEGNQTIRGAVQATKIVQQAGQSQVNINRMQSPVESVEQRAAEDQVNINRVRSVQVSVTCPDCGGAVGQGDRRCQWCGASLTPVSPGPAS